MNYNQNQLQKIGESHLIKFFSTLNKLVVYEKKEFDIILGAGNSGAGMVKCTQLFYNFLGRESPMTIKIPFYRSWNKPDIPYLIQMTKKLLNNKKVKDVLFVDDEIGRGETLKGVISILLKALDDNEKINVFVVAETKELKKFFKIKMAKTKFIPFEKKIGRGFYNIISKCIPININSKISKKYDNEELESSKRFNILLGEPIKEIKNRKPSYSYKWNKKLEKEVEEFDKLKNDFVKYVQEQIEKAV